MRSAGALAYLPRVSKQTPPQAAVIQLSDVRARRRLSIYQEKIHAVLASNRQAIGRLYTSGALFTRRGAKAGRDLLLAHQHLLRVVALINQLGDRGDVPAPKTPVKIDAVYRELDALLDRTNELTHRTGHYLARLRGE